MSTCMIINRSPTVASLMGIPNSAIRNPQSSDRSLTVATLKEWALLAPCHLLTTDY